MGGWKSGFGTSGASEVGRRVGEWVGRGMGVGGWGGEWVREWAYKWAQGWVGVLSGLVRVTVVRWAVGVLESRV